MTKRKPNRRKTGAERAAEEERRRLRIERREAAIKAARRRKLLVRSYTVGATIAVVTLLVVAVLALREEGDVSPEAWDLPAMGPTAEMQDRVRLADFRGKPTVVNFFASWCEQCDVELPGFRSVSQELGDQIDFVGIASQETGDPMFMPSKHGLEFWTLTRDIKGGNGSGLSRALGARGMPLTAFYDGGGNLLHVQLGGVAEVQLRDAISQLYGIET